MWKIDPEMLKKIKKLLKNNNKQYGKFNYLNDDMAKIIKKNEKMIKLIELNYPD